MLLLRTVLAEESNKRIVRRPDGITDIRDSELIDDLVLLDVIKEHRDRGAHQHRAGASREDFRDLACTGELLGELIPQIVNANLLQEDNYENLISMRVTIAVLPAR
jgi:hypothetical protein